MRDPVAYPLRAMILEESEGLMPSNCSRQERSDTKGAIYRAVHAVRMPRRSELTWLPFGARRVPQASSAK